MRRRFLDPVSLFDTGRFPNSIATRISMPTVARRRHDQRGHTVSILLGRGDGTLQPSLDFATGSSPSDIAIADFNFDGRADVVVANFGSNTVSVLLGNGDGTFGASVEFGTSSQPVSVTIADLNADLQLDLAIANFGSNTVSILAGNGDGTFDPKVDFGVGLNPHDVAVAISTAR
jgi:hypothetical protein